MIGTKIGGKHAADILYCIKPLSCGISRYSRQNLKNAEKWGSGIRNYLTLWRFGFSNIRAANMIMGLEFVCSKARHRHWYSLRQTVLVEYFKSPKNNISCVKNTWKSLKTFHLRVVDMNSKASTAPLGLLFRNMYTSQCLTALRQCHTGFCKRRIEWVGPAGDFCDGAKT